MTQEKPGRDKGFHSSLDCLRRIRRLEPRRRSPGERREAKVWAEASGGGGGHDDKAEVETKIVELQRVVPGGESLDIESLFEVTAGYILALKGQVKSMKLLAASFESLKKETGKFGG